MIRQIDVRSSNRSELIDITADIQQAVGEFGVDEGICHIFVPHTTAAVTINEGADPSVKRDIEVNLAKIIPERGDYRHMEGNSDAHIKSTLVGSSETLFIENGRLMLGTWQAIYFCEFDGPRQRKVTVKVL